MLNNTELNTQNNCPNQSIQEYICKAGFLLFNLQECFRGKNILKACNFIRKRLQHRRRSGVFIINFEDISNVILVFTIIIVILLFDV